MPRDWDNLIDLSIVPWLAQPGTVLISVATTAKQLVAGNPYRTNLFISSDGANILWIGNDSSIAANRGFALTTQGPIFELNRRDHGLLVTLPWFGISSQVAGVFCSVLEQSADCALIRRSKTMIEEVDDGTYTPVIERRTSRNGRVKLYTNSWAERQAFPADSLPDWNDSDMGE